MFELLPLEGGPVINYGADRIRFPASAPSGSRVRSMLEVIENDDLGRSRQMKIRGTVECDATDRPVCVASDPS